MSSACHRAEVLLQHLKAFSLQPSTEQLSCQSTAASVSTSSASRCPAASSQHFKAPIKVTVTGAAGNIAYALLFMIGQGYMAGPHQPIHLCLLDLPVMSKQVNGVIMELKDCAYPLLYSVTGTSDYKEAFTDCDIALLVGAKPRGPGMQRKDLLSANASIFSGQGKALDQYAKRTVKVLVVGNPANTNALIAASHAPNLPKSAFTAMTRLDENRAVSQIADRLKVKVGQVKNITIWGNHSKTQFPSVNAATLVNWPQASCVIPVRIAVNDNQWLDSTFLNCVQDRGAEIIQARGKSSAASAASAACDHMFNWLNGTAAGQYVSMGVWSDGQHYGIPAGINFSFPCVCHNGEWTIVDGLPLDEMSKEKIRITTQELLEEKRDALGQ